MSLLAMVLILTASAHATNANSPTSKELTQCDLAFDHLDQEAARISELTQQKDYHLMEKGCRFQPSEYHCPANAKGKDLPKSLLEKLISKIDDEPRKKPEIYAEMTSKALFEAGAKKMEAAFVKGCANRIRFLKDEEKSAH